MKQRKNKFNAIPLIVDNIVFKSGLEAFTYKALVNAGFKPEYEQRKFKLFNGFPYRYVQAYLPSKKSKHKPLTCLQLKTSKVLDIVYTPDFILEFPNQLIVIEVKGRANDRYPYVRKLFFQCMEEFGELNQTKVYFFEPHNQTHVNDMITILLTELILPQTYEKS